MDKSDLESVARILGASARNDLKVKSKVGPEMRLVKMKSSRYDDSYESDLNTILKSFLSGIMGNK
jgi:hypothetical protein